MSTTQNHRARRGFAMLTVLLVLLALLVLCAPFLMTARNASKASTQLADRAQARLALDSAVRNARATLGDTHPARDATPYYDDELELAVADDLEAEFVNPHDARGVMWEAVVHDVAGSIDWNSAPPQVFANALGATTRLVGPVKEDDKELTVSTTFGFPPVGFIWVGRELIAYTELDGQHFKKLVRGIGSREDKEGNPIPSGPQPASDHAPSTIVIDQRAFAPALWRSKTPDGRLREFDAPEQVRECADLALGIDAHADKLTEDLETKARDQDRQGEFDKAAVRSEQRDAVVREFVAPMIAHCSTYAGVRGGRQWQKPVRVKNGIRGGIDDLLEVDELAWFNPGTTVQLTDGQTTELGIVSQVAAGKVRLMDPPVNDYLAFTAEVRPLARRPVNVNLAPREVLVILFANLQVAGKNDRITRDEAERLADLVIESRPFTGFEDFLRRIVLPAAALETLPNDAPVAPDALAQGGKVIDAYDAVALYANALNANDALLAYATMPLCFTTREVFDFDVRAVVNAASGVERVTLVRNAVEMVVPQRDLMQLWARQEDWDELLRLDREAPWWATGPSATSMFDGASPPSRMPPNIGTHAGRVYVPGISQLPQGATAPAAAEHTFASREDTAWAQLWVSRVEETGALVGHVEHFDHESRDMEGRYLPDEPLVELSSSKRVAWTDTNDPLLRAFNIDLWIKPRTLASATYFDLGTSSLETDRVTLAVEDQDLVLRVLDGGGDITTTTLREAGEARFAIAAGEGPGLALETWSHVSIDVAGTRPSQITMLVDGKAHGVRTPGLTRLLTSIAESSTSITVESDEGFPDVGVLRIGNELIEYRKIAANTFDATPQSTGTSAGFGGRLARVPFTADGGTYGLPEPTYADTINTTHSAGTNVELYGYAAVLSSNVPSGSSTLPSTLGVWTVARAVGVVGGSTAQGDPISDTQILYPLGTGMEGASSTVTGIKLAPVDPQVTQSQVMAAFNTTGGYAALIQKVPTRITSSPAGGGSSQSSTDFETPVGTPIFGVEIVRYSGVTGSDTLMIQQRAALPALTAQAEAHAFVVNWDPAWTINGNSIAARLSWQTFVVPISVPAPGAAALAGFLPAGPNNGSEFAQITHVSDAENTEWVRYDSIQEAGYLVRHEAAALLALEQALTLGTSDEIQATVPPGPGGGGPIGPIDVIGPDAPSAPSAAALTSASSPAPAAQSTQSGYLWQGYLGSPESGYEDWVVTNAAANAFQFRGVFGTFNHDHAQGTLILPAWRVKQVGLNGGELGRLDEVILMEDERTALGWPARIFRAWQPLDHRVTGWTFDPSNAMVPVADPTAEAIVPEDAYVIDRDDDGVDDIAVALEAAATVPVTMTPPSTTGGAQIDNESRDLARVLKHPSGERPRLAENVLIGGTIRSEGIPSALADEVVFGSSSFGGSNPTQGGMLMLALPFAAGATTLQVNPDALRIAWGSYGIDDVSSQLPTDAGLLEIGDEILCYSAIDATQGIFTIATNGRGLLGTTEGTHEVGDTLRYLSGWTVGVLAGEVSASMSSLPLTDVDGFPQQGTVLIDNELVHYTRIAGATLDMPRRSKEPGKKDGKGDALFRGRFGTTPAGHSALTPVILFPFRYWDRWAERADAPELAYISPSIDQPNAFWRNVFWSSEEPATGQSRIEVLQRLTTRGAPEVPWDGSPDTTPGLKLLTEGMVRGEGNPIAEAADLIEWRAFVRYDEGAYDAATGLSHGWKETPRLRVFGVEYLGPNLVLRRVDQ